MPTIQTLYVDTIKDVRIHSYFSNTTVTMFTRQLLALYYTCVLTTALTTDIYKQHRAACPLLPAAAIRNSLCANYCTYFF